MTQPRTEGTVTGKIGPFEWTGVPSGLTAAALITLANSIEAGVLPIPGSVDVWYHDVSRRELLEFADRYQLKVHVARTEDGRPVQASITVGTKQSGLYGIELHMISKRLVPNDLMQYDQHNTECLFDPAAIPGETD